MRNSVFPSKIKSLVGTIAVVFVFTATFIVLDLAFSDLSKAHAYKTSCPKEIEDTPACLDFLNEQKDLIVKDKNAASQQISEEQYQQLSLLDKIAYLDKRISSIQSEIDSLEVEIGIKGVEIAILSEDILELENNISTISQEINRLENSVNKRISISYKYSFTGPLEILLETNNFDTLLRKMKYLLETRKKDKDLLFDLSEKSSVLEEENRVLSSKKTDVQNKLREIEDEKSKQFKLKGQLSTQRSERSVLYAESKVKEAELQAQLEAARRAQERVDASILAYIAKSQNKFINKGHVTKGQPIGRMGNKGCSSGAHLHFSISTVGYYDGYGNIKPWDGYLKKGPDYYSKVGDWYYYYVRSGSLQVPLSGDVKLNGGYHQGYAIDIASLQGEGALVYAAASGQIWLLPDDSCGNPYVRIIHDGGSMKTSYLHMNEFFNL